MRVLVTCVYVCLCELVRIRLYLSLFVCVRGYVSVCVRMHVFTCAHASLTEHVHICVRACLSLQGCVHLCMCVSVHVCVYISCVKLSHRVHPFPKKRIICYSNVQAASNQYLKNDKTACYNEMIA